MTYIISNIKKSLFVTLISILTLSIFTSNTYAGTGSIIQRGDPAMISWNVSNTNCNSTTNYPQISDNVFSDWSGSKNGQSNQTFPKVTAVPGSYTFYCTVPNNTGSGGNCTGTPGTGAQNVCWDSAVLTVNDCMPGSAWVASSLSCQVQVCIANTQTIHGCSQTSIGDVTHTCNSTGTDATGACTLTSCPGGAVISAGTCVCPAGQNMISASCVSLSLAYFNVMPSSCSIANGASSCPMILSWSVNGSTGTTVKDCNGTGSTF